MRTRTIALLLLVLVVITTGSIPSLGAKTSPPAHTAGLFSWKADVLKGDARSALFRRMERLGLGELYQSIPKDTPHKDVQAFLRAAAEHKIAVYLLTGDPAWGLDAKASAMTDALTRALSYNKGLTSQQQLRGLMMDVEPYSLEEWEKNPDKVMKSYVSAMRRARAAAEDEGLELVACIPYFYDELGQEKRLEALFAKGCHAVAVMNYDKKDEAANLETEAALSERYERPLIMIYELQAPGEHDLKEGNTYYKEGLLGVSASWEALQKELELPHFTYALHHYEALREVLGR